MIFTRSKQINCISYGSLENQNQEICSKELAHIIMEARRPQDLQSTSRRLQRADSIVPVCDLRPDNQGR